MSSVSFGVSVWRFAMALAMALAVSEVTLNLLLSRYLWAYRVASCWP